MAVSEDPVVTRSLADYLRVILRPYHVWIPVVVAVSFGLVTGLILLGVNVYTDIAKVKAIKHEVSQALKNTDFGGLEDLIRNISDEYHGHLLVIRDGKILASSCAKPNQHHTTSFYPIKRGFHLTSRRLTTEVKLDLERDESDPDTYLRLSTPLAEVIGPTKIVTLFVLLMSWFVSRFYGKKMMEAVNQALLPISHLESAIRDLKTLKDPKDLYSTGISELDSIRAAILETHRALCNARDTIAEIKAKDLATQNYKYLIHDLEKLAKALRSQTDLLADPELSEGSRKEVLALIPETANQLLGQLSAGRNNLDLEPSLLTEKDLISTVRDSLSNLRYLGRKSKVEIFSEFSQEVLLVPHDSHLIQRAVDNLVHNGLDAARTQIKLSIQNDGGKVVLRVEDDGEGIPEDEVSSFLLGRKKSTKGDRIAYGLAATSHIIRSHGWKLIYGRSQLGGACFEVIL